MVVIEVLKPSRKSELTEFERTFIYVNGIFLDVLKHNNIRRREGPVLETW